MNVARRASSKTLRPIRLRIAETLAVALLALVFQAPGVGAFEALDGRLQVHGFYAMQLRGMSADWKDQFDMTQWYNVLNLEIELDLAPDGFGRRLDPRDKDEVLAHHHDRISIRHIGSVVPGM